MSYLIHPETPAELGSLIRERRQENGETLEEVAEQTSVSSRVISRFERGEDKIRWPAVDRIIRCVGFEAMYLVAPWMRIKGFQDRPEHYEGGGMRFILKLHNQWPNRGMPVEYMDWSPAQPKYESLTLAHIYNIAQSGLVPVTLRSLKHYPAGV